MNKFRNVINKYIKDNEKRKRYTAFLLALSVLVMFFVPLELTENADSMTIGTPGGAILTEQLKNDVSSGIIDLSDTGNGHFESFTANVVTDNGENLELDKPTIDLSTGSSAGLTFNVEYTVNDLKNSLTKGANAHFCFPVTMVSNGSAVHNLTFSGYETIKDENYITDEMYGDTEPAGHYYIDNGMVYIQLTDDYIDFLVNREGATGTAIGKMEFEGSLGANGDAGESGKIKVGSEEIEVKFTLPEKTLGDLNKSAGQVSSDGKNVTWTITLDNSQGVDLNGYTMVDDMFAKATTITSDPSGIYEQNGNTLTFNSNAKGNIKIEYVTPIDKIFEGLHDNNGNIVDSNNQSVDLASVKNTVVLKNSEDKENGRKESTVNIKPTISKQGVPDYSSEKIKWTITVNNGNKIDLAGYTIEDSKFANESITIKYDGNEQTINASNGVLTLPNDIGNPGQITIEYSTPANAGKDENNQNKNPNTAILKKGELTVDKAEHNPEYKEESAMYSLNKSGRYDADTGKITWTVEVKATETGMSLTGYKLVDSAFNGKELKDFNFTYAGNMWDSNNLLNNNSIEKYVDFSGNTMTFKKATDGGTVEKVLFTYTTNVTPGDAIKNETNSIELDKPNNPPTPVVSKDVTVEVEPARNTFTKTVDQSNVSAGKTNGEKEVTLHWTVTLISDNGFAGKTFDDIFTAKQGDTDLTSRIENVKLYSKKSQNDYNKTEITNSGGFTANGADITFANDFTTPNNEHYIVIEYDTVVTLPKVTDSSKYDSDGKITYTVNNSGSGDFGVGPGEGVGVTITRENPNANNTKFSLGKSWNWNGSTNANAIQKVYAYIEVKDSNNQTYYVAYGKDTDSYKLVNSPDYTAASANGNGILFELNSTDNWNKEFKGLPTSREGENGTLITYTYTAHEYSINDTNTTFDNGKDYIVLDNGSIVKRTGEWQTSISNTYYPNDGFTVKKSWDGDNGSGSDVQSITVQIQRKENGGEWKDYKSETISGSNWTKTFDSTTYPKAVIDDNGNIVEYSYRVIEKSITMNNKVITSSPSDDNKIIFVNNNGDYYETNNVVTVNGTEITLANTYHKASNITISAEKKWNVNNIWHDYDSLKELREANSDVVYTSLKSVNIKLQKKAVNADAWDDVPNSERVIDAEGNITKLDGTPASLEWDNLEKQAVNSEGELVKYEYQVVEYGFTTTFNDNGSTADNEVKFVGNTFAPNPNSSYTISYNGNKTSTDGAKVTIKNTYVPESTIQVQPTKAWTYDESDKNDFAKSIYRADSVTFVLQQKNSKGHQGEWVDYKLGDDIVTVTLTKSDNNDTTDSGNTNWTVSTVSPESVDLTKLPEGWVEKIEDEQTHIRTYKPRKYEYRFVETSVIVNGTPYALNYGDAGMYADSITGETEQIKFSDGEQSKYISSTNGYNVDNRFKPNKGIEKYSVDKNANKVKSIDIEELQQYKHKLSDGNEYYIFNYVIEYTKSEMKAVVDTLPEDFSLVEEIYHKDGQGAYFGNADKTIGGVLTLEAGMNPNAPAWTDSTLQGGLVEAIGDGYYAAPINFIIAPFEQYKIQTEWAGYFQGWKDKDTNTRYEITEVFQQYSNKYRYEEDTRKLYIANVSLSNSDATAYYGYSIKIEKDKLEEKLSNGTFSIVNTAEKREYNGDDTGLKSENTLVIKKPDNLIDKAFAETLIPGQVKYTIDVNPDAKTLSNGSTVHITDVFDTISYTLGTHKSCKNHNPSSENGSRLVDVLLNSLKVYAYDANGNKVPLKSNEYTFVFKNGTDTKEGAATLELNVPDSTHISIEYTYKLIANENTPAVKQGCKSTTMENGRYPVMKSGMTLPTGDKITMKNKARLETESNSAEKEKVVNNYEIKKSSGTISTTLLPKIQKVNIADYTINDLEADFLLAYYGEDEAGDEGWVYATIIEDKEVTWGKASETIPNDAYTIHLDGIKPYEVNLSDGVLYRLIEVGVPEGYEGSNLKKPVGDTLVAFTEDDYRVLITNYFNSGETEYEGTDYSDFLKTFVFEHYFVYNAVPSSVAKPAGFDTNNIMQYQTGATVEVPNNELIKIKVEKDWVNFSKNFSESVENTSIILQLFWSDKNESAIPNNAAPATAENLGLMEYQDFEPVVEVTYSTSAETVWTELPNGHGNTPIYYYVKEIGYRIGDDLYMLEESFDQTTAEKVSAYKPATEYKMSETEIGKVDVKWDNSNNAISEYLPTYVNNAVNSNLSESVKITNSNVLKLHKIWTDSENKILPWNSGKINTDSIEVEIFGVEENGAQSSSLFGKIELKKDNKWYAEISEDELEDIDFSKYVSFVAKETGLPTGTNFITSVTFRINNDTGEITVTNKNPDAVSASVSVDKVWSDGNNVHKSDSIEVTLYQVEKSKAESANLAVNPTAAELKAADAVVYGKSTTEGEETSETITNPVTLNADNDWSYIWSGLPLDDADDQPDGESTTEYVYYVVESNMSIEKDAGKYTSNVTREKTGSNYAYTISNERPSITVKKEWYNEDDKTIDAPVDEIQVRLYKEGTSVPTSGLEVVAVGDSITKATTYGVTEEGAYPRVLEGLLQPNFKGSSVTKSAENGMHIDELKNSYLGSITKDTDVICILGGTNDIHHASYQNGLSVNHDYNSDNLETLKAETKSAMKTKMTGLINSAKSKNENDAVILVGTIPYFVWNPSDTNKFSAWNWWWNSSSFNNKSDYEAACKALVDAANEGIKEIADNDSRVILVDVCSSLLNSSGLADESLYFDGCHLNADGCSKVANAYYNAISNYYTPKEYLKTDGTFTSDVNDEGIRIESIAKNGNWTKVIDLPSGFDKDTKLSVEEVENENLPRTSWTVSYENNSQTSLSTGVIVIKNKNTPPKTEIEINKHWANDNATTDAALRDKLSFTVFRSTDQENWEEVSAEDKTDKTVGDNTWKITYENLPAESPEGIAYSYKIKENELEGYTCGAITQTVTGGKIKFDVTNTRSVSITVKKDWSDINTKDHNGDTVKVKLWRTLNPDSVNSELPLTLMVDSTSVSMGVNSEHTINTNRTDATFVSDNPDVVSVDENGKLTSHDEAGTAKITVTAGNESVVVDVTVVNLTISVNNTMKVGGTQNVKVFTDPTTEITSRCNFSSDNSEILTIDRNGNITAIDVGTANIIVECKIDGTELKVSKEITVVYTGGFTLKDANENTTSEIAVNDSITLTPDPAYGDFEFTSGDGATITKNGKSVIVTAGDTPDKTVTITAIRLADEKLGITEATSTYVLKIVENPKFVLKLNGVGDVTNSYPNGIDYFEVPLNDGLTFTSNKVITKVKVSGNWFLHANDSSQDEVAIGEKTFKISVGGIKQTYDFNYVTFTVYYQDGSEEKSETYHAHVVDQPTLPTITISTKSTVVTLTDEEQRIPIEITPADAHVSLTKTPENNDVSYDNGELIIGANAVAGSVKLTASKEGYTNGELPITLSDGSVTATEVSFNSEGPISFNAGSTIQSVTLELNDSNAGSWPYVILYFNDNNKVKVGYSGNIPLCKEDNSSSYTNIDDAVLNSDGKSVTVTFKDNWQPDSISITNLQNGANGKVTIAYGGASTVSVASFSLSRDSVAILADEPTGIEWEDNHDGREYYEFDIRKSDNWEKTITGLEVGKDGVNYCYWVEELPMQNYTASYNYDGEFEKHSISQTGGIVTIKNTPDTVYEGVEMPNSGGSGTAPYTTVGMIIAGGAVIALTVRRRRRKSA